MHASFITTEDVVDWEDANRFVLGSPSRATASTVATVGIRLGTKAQWRVDVFPSVGHSCFQDVRCVGDLIYIGYGQQVAVLSPATGSLTSYSLDGYFGCMCTALDPECADLGSSVLVASASELLCFDGTGRLIWRKSELGVDGVVIRQIRSGEIVGDAEWDPPGGWKPFRLRLDTGTSRS